MAITYVNSSYGNNTTGVSPTYAGAVAIGDLLVIRAHVGFAASNITGVVFTDNVNSGGWTTVESTYYSSGNRQNIVAYKVANAACAGSVLAVTSSQLNTFTTFWSVASYNGFLGTPTLAGTDFNDTQNLTTTAVAATTFNTSDANELVLAWFANAGGTSWTTSPTTTGWTERRANNANTLYDKLVSSAGTSTGLTGTLSASDTSYISQMGFYDAAAGSFPPVPESRWAANQLNALMVN